MKHLEADITEKCFLLGCSQAHVQFIKIYTAQAQMPRDVTSHN